MKNSIPHYKQYFKSNFFNSIFMLLIAVVRLLQRAAASSSKRRGVLLMASSGARFRLSTAPILVFLLCIGFAQQLEAQENIEISVNTPAAAVAVDQDFTVTVEFQEVDGQSQNLTYAEIALQYDPTILQVNTVVIEPVTNLGGNVLKPLDFSTPGIIKYGVGVPNFLTEGIPGTFTFLTVDFKALAPTASSPLEFLNSGNDESFAAIGGLPVSTTIDGDVAVVGANTPPVFITNIANQTNNEMDVVSLSAAATDTESTNLAYSQTGLPAGLGIDPTTGLISGTVQVGASTGGISGSGVYPVTITVMDDGTPILSATQNFEWTVEEEVVIVDYTITASPGANGTIDPLSATVAAGGSQIFTITPDPGYEVADVLVDGNTVGAVTTHEITNVQANTTISASFSLIIVDTVPEITLDATATVDEGGTLSVPLSISDADGDDLTVTISSASNEPANLHSNQGGGGGAQRDPFPFDAAGFLAETGISNNSGTYTSSLDFNPVFGDGGSDGDGNGVYTITVSVSDEDGNTINQTLDVTVNDVAQFVAESLTTATRIQAESFDNQGPPNPGSGTAGIGVEVGPSLTNIGFTNNGDFAEYLIDVETAGNYEIDFLVSRNSNATHTMTVNGGPSNIVVPNNGNWSVFESVTTVVTLAAGPQTLRFDWSGGGGFYFNMDYFDIQFLSAPNNPPTIDAIADVEVDEGDTVTVNIQVNDDTDPSASIIIYDKSVPGGTNNPFTPVATVNTGDYSFTDNGSGSYTLEWVTDTSDGRSYEARVMADDGVNTSVEDIFTIDIAQDITEAIPGRTFSNPLPWYGGSPQAPFTVAIEDNLAQNLGWTNPGEFVEYVVDVPNSGTYDVEFLAGKGDGGPFKITLSEENGVAFTSLGDVDIALGAWQTYVPYTFQVEFSNSGVQTIRLDFSGSGGANIQEFSFVPTANLSPTIDPIADVTANEGEVLSIPIVVTDDTSTAASIVVYDKSINTTPINTNTNPYTSGGVISGYTFEESPAGSGNYTLSFPSGIPDSRSYFARVTADDGVNPAVSETFNIDIAHEVSSNASVPSVLDATTFSNPLPWYGNNPQAPFTVSIENSGTNIGYIGAGEFVAYLIDVPAAGLYDINFTSANGSGANGSSTNIEIFEEGNNTLIGFVSVPKTSWGNYQDYQTTVQFVNSGLQTLRLEFDGGVNTQKLEFAPSTSNTPPAVVISAPNDGIALTTGTNIDFSGSASDIQDGDISANISWSSDLDGPLGTGANISFALTSVGTHIITASVTDNDATTPLMGTATITLIVTETDPSCDARFRVNAGGPVLIADSGNFEEDQAASGSDAGSSANPGTPSPYINLTAPAVDKTFGSNTPLVSNTTGYPDFLFQTERFSTAVDPDNMKWSFPTGNGIFEVKMLFNENWSGENSQPQNNRIFDVIVEGNLALDDYRPSGPIGADFNVAKVETYMATVEDGVLNIDFLKISENPSIKGFDICFVSDLPTDTPPVVSITSPTTNGDPVSIARGTAIDFVGTATDAEDDDTTLTSALSWSIDPFEPNFAGTGGSFSDALFIPGVYTITATTTDSDANVASDDIEVTVLGPDVDFVFPDDSDIVPSTELTVTWTALNMFLQGPDNEHFHLWVNPADTDNLVPEDRISTAGQPEQLFWNLGAAEGIVEGENTIVIIAAESGHEEFTNPEATDLVTFTVTLPVVVPDVVNATQAAATIAIDGADLVVGNITNANSATVPLGSVISQNPIGGSMVDEGSSVDLVISLGPVQVNVPNVVGNTQAVAESTIVGASLAVGNLTTVNNAFVPAGSVISQNPVGGNTVDEGSSVDLVISLGAVQVNVPDVVGNTQADAEAAILNASLIVGAVTEENSDTVAAGDVISQDPVGGNMVDEGSPVNLVVSLGVAQVTVPDVVDATQAAAEAAILNADLVVGSITDANSATVPLGSVISQNPIGGSMVDEGSSVDLVISLGPVQVNVPNVVGNTQAVAESTIVGASLAVGNLTTANNAFVPAGSIISQNPVGGSTVDEGSSVDLVISLGAVQVNVPNVVGNTQAAAEVAILNASLIVGNVTEENSDTVAAGDVISQDPVGGNMVDEGSPVNLVVSLGVAQVTVPDVVDATQAAAEAAILNADLVVGSITNANSATVPLGSVISQNPIGGSMVDEGSSVDLVISLGVAQVTVPDVVDATQASATIAIDGADLVVGNITNANSVTVPLGSVISQNPIGGSMVDEGSSVDLVISLGPVQVNVPNVVGNTQAAAEVAILNASLIVGNVTEENSDTVAAGDVISQDPVGGNMVDEGSPVNLVVSLGAVQVGNTELTVLDATTDTPLFDLVDGMVIQKSDIGNTPLGVIYNTDFNPNGVFFTLTGPLNESRNEGPAPHSLFGDIGIDIQGKPFPVGDYTLIANPQLGPTLTINFTVSDVDPACVDFDLMVSSQSNSTSCINADGEITVVTTGSTAGPITYSWAHDSNLTGNSATGLEAGSYTVTATDGAGCSKSLTIELEGPELPSVSLSSFSSVLETAPPFALIGGSPAGGTYSGQGVSNGMFDPSIGPGSYAITYSYTDSETGCENSATKNILVTSATGNTELIVLDATTDTPLFDLVDGMVIPKSDIGETPLGIIFNTDFDPNGVFFTLTGPINESRNEGPAPHSLFGDIGVDIQGKPFPVGEYTLVANPQSGPTVTVNFEVSAEDPICASMNVTVQPETNPSTCGGSDGAITVSISGATMPYQYNWSHDGSLQSSTASGLSAGTYSVTVTDANGCSKMVSATLDEPDGPDVSLGFLDTVMDTDPPFNLTGGLPVGGSYSGTGVNNGMFDPSIGAGTYVVTYSFTDPNTGCENSATRSIKVTSINSTLTVLSFTLVNADNDEDLFVIEPNSVISINSLPTLNLNIRANTTDDVESVKFVLTGAQSQEKTESLPPYALYGDFPVGEYFINEFVAGDYLLMATPYSQDGLGGTMGTSLTIGFELRDAGNLFLKRANVMEVSPNPADATATITFNKPVKVNTIHVFDVIGRLVKTYKGDAELEVYSKQLGVQDLPAGTYFVRTTDVKGVEFQQQMAIKR